MVVDKEKVNAKMVKLIDEFKNLIKDKTSGAEVTLEITLDEVHVFNQDYRDTKDDRLNESASHPLTNIGGVDESIGYDMWLLNKMALAYEFVYKRKKNRMEKFKSAIVFERVNRVTNSYNVVGDIDLPVGEDDNDYYNIKVNRVPSEQIIEFLSNIEKHINIPDHIENAISFLVEGLIEIDELAERSDWVEDYINISHINLTRENDRINLKVQKILHLFDYIGVKDIKILPYDNSGLTLEKIIGKEMNGANYTFDGVDTVTLLD
jgi:hypothetical protein